MPISGSALGGITGNTARGSAKIWSVTELQRVGNSLQPTGVEFKWSSDNFASPRGAWQYSLGLRTVRHDLPGSEEPVEQVLGWNYMPFTVQGVWDDRHAGAGFADQTRRDFEEMVKRGNFVKLQFEQISVTGLITNVEISYRRKDLIGYRFTFSPHFRFEGETVRVEINPNRKVTTDPRTSVKLARNALDALQAQQNLARSSSLSRVQQLLADDTFGDINDALDDMETSITAAEKTVNDEILVAQDAANALNRGAQIMASVKTAVSTVLSTARKATSTGTLAVETMVETLQFNSWLRGVAGQASALVVATDRSRQDFSLRANPKPKTLHRARQGESLYAISTRYYGTPHHWREILTHNKLASIILQGGELLEIPELR